MTYKKSTLKNNGTTVSFLETGDLYEILKDNIMINQLHGNALDSSVNQLYLRVYDEKGIHSVPMIGSNSDSEFSMNNNRLIWKGTFSDVSYQVVFQIAESGIWFWQVGLTGSGQKVDVIYGQDIGNAAKGAVRSNEAYMSQYVDHHITKENETIIISSRQNQPQAGKFPVVEQGSLNPLVGFSTDGYQFFGREYKETNQAKALTQTCLANEVYQYEFAYVALQTQTYLVSEVETEVVFYGAALDNQERVIEKPLIDRAEIIKSYDSLKQAEAGEIGTVYKKNLGAPLIGKTFTDEERNKLFPQQNLVEMLNGNVASFYTDDYHHVVLKEKEIAMERAHGHILLSGTDLTVDKPLMSTTVYMYGLFNSQIVLGNTSMNKLMSNSRNSLNILKQSGQRIYIKEGNIWRILTMPSAFEMGLNSAVWYYKLENDIIKVTTFTLCDTREIRTEVTSQKGLNYTFAVTNQLVMNGDEEEPAYKVKKEKQQVMITATSESIIHEEYPELTYYFVLDKPFELTDERLFLAGHSHEVLTTIVIKEQKGFTMEIQGSLVGENYQAVQTTFQYENEQYLTFINDLLNNFQLTHKTENVESMNVLARWYTHNMLVHYLSPHGLEQYGGAAWGTRDVSQGPTEFFFAVNRPEIVRSIIKNVYANQFEDDGNWPQWFMFDRYETQKADESHGDVIVWPMKIVADYLAKTKDFTILEEVIPYTNRQTFLKTAEKTTLFDHVKKEIQFIEDNFLAGTYLSCYSDGDWDDTLQPYDSKLKKYMASSWTVALTYQVVKKLAGLLAEVDSLYGEHLVDLSNNIKKDYEKYILSTQTIPGFVYMEDTDHVELMIHPTDKKTGIQYRLLPMTRSMIAELLTIEQAEHHYGIIKEQLQFPDGVRLMNRPANYNGGVSTNFKRAEQSANFGREIGLQYVHAHIRFTEAMAKLGKTDETWRALNVINPIQMKEHVPNAEIRQSNAYFSSSDGDFKTRYDAQENFSKLKDGSVGVKGGWRIYSSGPGIYLNQMLSNVLGIREEKDQIIFDPILPNELNELEMTYQLAGKDVQLVFHLDHQKEAVLANGKELTLVREENPYRQGGYVVRLDELTACLDKEKNKIDIFC
ncbi:GH36-type glycosyl hydrolase domain-containing protein [Enterococcus sp. 5H]|uniref:GH36-type glycosyl hydrolase domain-containing protein n=1 Tax=Enterococcus sp. 5H TaxID=1229490 RepID=UPI002302FD6D|nr:cellobiose phosphorylase [Enterococcus sp. 5H]MDA9470990.1 sugar phosphorylase [Enterococcus sp. 5H]